jgi:carbonic anhydrase
MKILSSGRSLVTISTVGLAALAMSAAGASSGAPSILPSQALRQLLEGNQRYVKDQAEHPAQRPSDAPQHPLAVILSCSDSRAPTNIIFDQGGGSLFVVRVAGNTYDRLALQSIDYAVAHLGVTLIMVIGHDQCGAVTAAVASYPDPNAGPMLTNIYPAVRKARGTSGDVVSKAIDYNAILIADRLEHEPELAAKIKKGELKIQPARYILKTGEVKLLQ